MTKRKRKPLPHGVRPKVLIRDGYRCSDCNKVKPAKYLEVDHVIEHTDGGSDDLGNLATRCKPCHRKKSAASMRKRIAIRKHPNVTVPEHLPLSWVRYPTGIALLGYVLAHWIGIPAFGAMFVVTVAIGVLSVALYREVQSQRKTLIERLHKRACDVTNSNPTKKSIRRIHWDGTLPRKFMVYYGHDLFNDADVNERNRLVDELEHVLGFPLFDEWRPWSGCVILRKRLDTDPPRRVPLPEPEKVDQYVDLDTAIRSIIDMEPVHIRHYSDSHFKVSYPPGYRDEKPDTRLALQERVLSKTQQRWKATWDTVRNTVDFSLRPEMPAVVPHPVPTELNQWKIPLGIDENSDPVYWDLKVAPHLLTVGSTGGGKTVFISGILTEAAQRGFDIILVDGKGTTFAGFRNWPGVIDYGLGEPDEMSDAMTGAETLVRDRYRQIRNGEVRPGSFKPVLVLLDEAAEFAVNVEDWYKSIKQTGMPTKAPALKSWKSIARLGREARVHMVMGIQQAASAFFGGTEARDNFAARVACGPVTQEGAKMAFGRTDIGRDIPVELKGRGTVDIGGEPIETQFYWTPAPLPDGTILPEDMPVLMPLRPEVPEPTVPEPKLVTQRVLVFDLKPGDKIEFGEVIEIEDMFDGTYHVKVMGDDGVENVELDETETVLCTRPL